VLDVKGRQDREGQTVGVGRRHNGANQRWKVVYVDKAPKVNKKDLVKEWGFS
jgi:hypothetical protein